MKPYKDYKGYQLKDIIPTAIALVTKGANNKRFCLFKLNLNKGDVSMKKETALTLVKAGKLSDDEVKLIVESVAEADRAEVQKAADELKKSAPTIDVDSLATSIAEKINKANTEKLTAISDSLKQTVTILEKLSADSKGGDKKDEDPVLNDAEIKKLLEDEAGKEKE